MVDARIASASISDMYAVEDAGVCRAGADALDFLFESTTKSTIFALISSQSTAQDAGYSKVRTAVYRSRQENFFHFRSQTLLI